LRYPTPQAESRLARAAVPGRCVRCRTPAQALAAEGSASPVLSRTAHPVPSGSDIQDHTHRRAHNTRRSHKQTSVSILQVRTQGGIDIQKIKMRYFSPAAEITIFSWGTQDILLLARPRFVVSFSLLCSFTTRLNPCDPPLLVCSKKTSRSLFDSFLLPISFLPLATLTHSSSQTRSPL